MAKIKNNEKKSVSGAENEVIKINVQEKSSLAEFTKRPLPSEKELEDFEEYVEGEAREQEVKASLSEIYQDEKGGMVDVQKLDIKKKRGFLFWFIVFIFASACLATVGYGAYYYYMHGGSDPTNVKFEIEGREKALAGEEFAYAVNYKNGSKSDINDIKIRLIYPDNFIFTGSTPAGSDKNDFWQIGRLMPGQSGKIEIKGKIVNSADYENIIIANMTYAPSNFSSEFKKEASYITSVSDTGINFNFESGSSALVGDKNEIAVKFNAKEKNYLDNFRMSAEPLDNIEFIAQPADGKGDSGAVNEKPGVWQAIGISGNDQEIKAVFKVKEKIADSQDIKFVFEYKNNDGKYYKFFEKVFSYEIIKSELNLSLIINGSRNDQGTDFGQTLNCSVVYANKGAKNMNDVIIMAVMEGDFLDYNSLAGGNNGKMSGNTISWSKEEIPGLEVIEPNQEGMIDFSIKLLNPVANEFDPSKSYQIKSYAQFNIGSGGSGGSDENADNRSNTIINKINSDLTIDEQIRYFNDDNIAVGSGPLPPKAGETTSYKVYWVLTNNLHELKNLQVETVLPDYIEWDGKNRSSAGSLYYDSATRKVIWQIGRLPITVYRLDAEFNIALTPNESQRNQIVVLTQGTTAQAVDNETESSIVKTTKPKTTKLEDDEIANMNSDGRVE